MVGRFVDELWISWVQYFNTKLYILATLFFVSSVFKIAGNVYWNGRKSRAAKCDGRLEWPDAEMGCSTGGKDVLIDLDWLLSLVSVVFGTYPGISVLFVYSVSFFVRAEK